MIDVTQEKRIKVEGVEIIVTPKSGHFNISVSIQPLKKHLSSINNNYFIFNFEKRTEYKKEVINLTVKEKISAKQIKEGLHLYFISKDEYICSLFLCPDILFSQEEIKQYKKEKHLKRILKNKKKGKNKKYKGLKYKPGLQNNGSYTNYSSNNARNPFGGGTFSSK